MLQGQGIKTIVASTITSSIIEEEEMIKEEEVIEE